MKYLFILMVLAFLAACGVDTGNKQPSAAEKDKNKKEVASSGNSCTDMVAFQNGAKIYTETTDSTGSLISNSTSTIKNVRSEDGYTIADAELRSTDPNGKSTNINVRYKCDGQNIYVDMGFFANVVAGGGGNMKASEMSFPVQLSEGQKLPDTNFEMTMGKGGKEVRITASYKNRHVEGKETIETPAGSWECYKVVTDIDMKMDIPGVPANVAAMMDQQMQQRGKPTSVFWFSPLVGIVKCDVYFGKKPTAKTILKKIEK